MSYGRSSLSSSSSRPLDMLVNATREDVIESNPIENEVSSSSQSKNQVEHQGMKNYFETCHLS